MAEKYTKRSDFFSKLNSAFIQGIRYFQYSDIEYYSTYKLRILVLDINEDKCNKYSSTA